MDVPLITIFIPTYKRPHRLRKAIRSCQTQTHQNIRIVVSDNASNDETFEIVQAISKEDDRIYYFCHPTNVGMLNNYQHGLSTINTEFFSFLSDDDILLPHFCEVALKNFSQFPDIAFSACSTAIISDKKGVVKIPLDLWPREGRYLPFEGITEMLGDKYPVPTTVLFRTQFISNARIDFDNQVLWDCDFLIQMAGQFPFAISKKVCGIFFNHSGSFSASQNIIMPLQRLADRVGDFAWMEKNIRNSALKKLRVYTNKICVRSILFDLLYKRFSAASKTAQYLIKKKITFRHLSLWLSVKIFSAFPFLSCVLVLLKKVRDRKRKENWVGYEEYKS
jgi:glycosyltransferase involved in cell wall biosynthesis